LDVLKHWSKGDSLLDSVIKTAGQKKLVGLISQSKALKGPVVLYEAANWVAFGGAKVGDVTSHFTTFKEGGSMLYDKFWDVIQGTDRARERLEKGHYGTNLQNVHVASEILAEWSYSEGQMAEDISNVVTDPGFYEGMRQTNEELWRPAEGTSKYSVRRPFLWVGRKASGAFINVAQGVADGAAAVGRFSTRLF
jgi:hypothetical protein